MAHTWWHPNTRNWGKAPQVLSEEEKAIQRALGEEGLSKMVRSIMNFSPKPPVDSTLEQGKELLEEKRLGLGSLSNRYSSDGSVPYRSSSSFMKESPYKNNTESKENLLDNNRYASFQDEKKEIAPGITQPRVGPSMLELINLSEEEVVKEGGDKIEENSPSLWETWGSLADDPRKRKDAYLGSIKNIYMKKMMLDSIANLTGGQSQGGSWAEMAIAELDAVEKFDSEERLHNQWKALFFNENGDYNPPKNRKEAMERGQKLNYNVDQMKDILSIFGKEEKVSKTQIQKEIEYFTTAFGLTFEQAREMAFEKAGLSKRDERDYSNWYRIVDGVTEQAVARKGDRPKGEGWLIGDPPRSNTPQGNVRERDFNKVQSFIDGGKINDAITYLESIFLFNSQGDIASNPSTRRNNAIEIVWNKIDPLSKIELPEGINSEDKLQKWENDQSVSNSGAYYLIKTDSGLGIGQIK